MYSASLMPLARSFRDLRVYRIALDEADVLFRRTGSFPPDERFGLTDQLRRSSSAVSALIAEAWPRRYYRRAFVNTLRLAVAESCETQAWLDHAHRRGYISDAEFAVFDDAWEHVSAMLYRMIGGAANFPHGPSRPPLDA